MRPAILAYLLRSFASCVCAGLMIRVSQALLTFGYRAN